MPSVVLCVLSGCSDPRRAGAGRAATRRRACRGWPCYRPRIAARRRRTISPSSDPACTAATRRPCAIAIRALGRLERPALIADSPALRNALPEIRSEAANAIAQAAQGWKARTRRRAASARDAAFAPLAARLKVEADPDVRDAICESIGRLPYATRRRPKRPSGRSFEMAANAVNVTDRLGVAQGFEALRPDRAQAASAERRCRDAVAAAVGCWCRARPSTGARVRRLALEALITAAAVDDEVLRTPRRPIPTPRSVASPCTQPPRGAEWCDGRRGSTACWRPDCRTIRRRCGSRRCAVCARATTPTRARVARPRRGDRDTTSRWSRSISLPRVRGAPAATAAPPAAAPHADTPVADPPPVSASSAAAPAGGAQMEMPLRRLHRSALSERRRRRRAGARRGRSAGRECAARLASRRARARRAGDRRCPSAPPRRCRSSPASRIWQLRMYAARAAAQLEQSRRARDSSRATRTTTCGKRRSTGCASWRATTPTPSTSSQLTRNGHQILRAAALALDGTPHPELAIPALQGRMAAADRGRARQLARRARRDREDADGARRAAEEDDAEAAAHLISTPRICAGSRRRARGSRFAASARSSCAVHGAGAGRPSCASRTSRRRATTTA